MEFQSPYVTAPASPMAGYGGAGSAVQFYSVPASPTRDANNAFSAGGGDDGASSCSNFDSFEFETSRKFVGAAGESDRGERRRERGGSLPSMAFADQLFDNGRVMPMPLKPPPRFRIDGGGDVKSCSERLSGWSSPKSPAGSVFRVPFSRRNVWNDDYDPFMAALQKVKEENRGRKSISMYGDGDDHHHRRTRSFSPFRRINGEDETWGFNKETVIGPVEPKAEPEPKPKGSMYARWVLYQTQNMGRSPKTSTTKKTRPNKPTSNGGIARSEDTKIQKIKGIIVRYTSFGKENGNSKGKEVKNPVSSILSKSNYFKKFSFKYGGNRRENRNQNQDKNENRNGNGNGESRIVLVKLQPPMCLGYGVQSPRNMQRSELST